MKVPLAVSYYVRSVFYAGWYKTRGVVTIEVRSFVKISMPDHRNMRDKRCSTKEEAAS